MSKAILITDMPDNCASCKFFNDHYDYPECIITGETKGYKFNKYKKKMKQCPLKNLCENKVKIKQKEICDGYDCWGRPEYDYVYVVLDENGNEIFRSKNDPTRLVNILTKNMEQLT